MRAFEFWGVKNQDACRARPRHRPSQELQSVSAPAESGLGRPWKADFFNRAALLAGRNAGVISRAHIPVLVSSMAGETIQRFVQKPRVIHAMGTDAPSARAAVPDDPALPGLALLHRPEKLLAVLTPLLSGRLGSHIELAQNDLFVRRYVPGKRCTVKSEVTTCAASGMPRHQCFFAKFNTGGHGAVVYKNCQQLWRRSFSRGRFTIVEPLAYHPSRQVLVLSWEDGTSLRDIVLAGQGALRAVEGAAKWLHRLHTCGLNGGRICIFSHHLHILGIRKRDLISTHREVGRAFGEVLDRIKRRLAKLEPLTWGPTHRDFSPEHLIVEGRRFTALDFDEFCQYDSLIDVAHFVAHLRFLALISSGAVNSMDDLAAHFEDSYASESASFSAARLHLFAAIAYLKLAYVEALVRRNRDGKQVVNALLEEAGRFADSENCV